MARTYVWIIGVVALYMLAMLAIGYWASKRVKDTRDYIATYTEKG